MREIRLTYYDPDIGLSEYILMFFRMIGVFIHKCMIRTEQDKQKYDAVFLPSVMNIVVWNSALSDMYHRGENPSENIFYLVSKDQVEEIQNLLGVENNLIVYSPEKDKYIDILKSLLQMISEIVPRCGKDLKILYALAEIYEKHKLMDAFLGTRFFISDQSVFDDCCQQYVAAFDEIEDRRLKSKEENFYAMFGMVYLAYECNYALKRLDRVFLFDVDSMLEALDDISEETTWDSLDLLYAQIYDDLLGKTEKAKKYYQHVIAKSSNDFAWYKMGVIYEDVDKNYESASLCMDNALEINHLYYKALYHAGYCQLSMEDQEDAYDYFEALVERLQLRHKERVMRVVDIEYYYKTCIALGNLDNRYFGKIYSALEYYRRAESLWEETRSDKGQHLADILCSDNEYIWRLLDIWCESVDYQKLHKSIENLSDYVQNYERLMQIWSSKE